MFSFQQNDELVVQDPPCNLISFQQEDHGVVELHEHVSMVESTTKISTRKRGGNEALNNPNLATAGLQIQKKLVHREIEKQRRKEMAKLYASLKGLLPLEFIKGRHSTSDHMQQAVHYIKQMQKNVEGLSMKRDQLKKCFEINANQSLINRFIPNTVSVSSCNGGVEVLINSCSIEDGFILSGLLNELVKEGLNVTSCISTKGNDRLLHSIQSEASDLGLIDLSMLEQRLVLVANNQPNFN
ncbi:hypothetical protein L6452_05077 [Arctium lappa]|uniref:Uncharacterized protein n=1 Tax=Arctium lappa TaxID=4217 RepID=A0ACB9EFE7_ARCLA|nr:hypothetical protein L6452_05077 [Arctium lappa]